MCRCRYLREGGAPPRRPGADDRLRRDAPARLAGRSRHRRRCGGVVTILAACALEHRPRFSRAKRRGHPWRRATHSLPCRARAFPVGPLSRVRSPCRPAERPTCRTTWIGSRVTESNRPSTGHVDSAWLLLAANVTYALVFHSTAATAVGIVGIVSA